MASRALREWEERRLERLDELEEVHRRVSGTAPGRRWLTEELDRSYILALASQFQGFSRDLHSEAAAFIARQAPVSIRAIVDSTLTTGRQLDRGNATPSSIGADFSRFGIDFWPAVRSRHRHNARRQEQLEQVNIWRNAIAHDSPMSPDNAAKVVGTKPTMTFGRRWRRGIGALAVHFDAAVAGEIEAVVGVPPW